MKYSIFIVLLFIGIAHGFLGSIGQGIGNTIDQLKNTTGNIAGQILHPANGIQFSARFLWDSVFSPAFDLLIAGGQLLFNDKFGAIGSVVRQPVALPENPFEDKYAELVARLKTNIHTMYEQLFLIEQEAMKAIEQGEMNIEERIRAFHDKIDAIEKQFNQWTEEMKSDFEVYALTIAGDWEDIIRQYKENIDSTVQSIERMFQQLTEHLIKNLKDFIP